MDKQTAKMMCAKGYCVQDEYHKAMCELSEDYIKIKKSEKSLSDAVESLRKDYAFMDKENDRLLEKSNMNNEKAYRYGIKNDRLEEKIEKLKKELEENKQSTYTDMTALYHPTLVAFLKKENKELKEANECLLNQRKELGIENDEDLCCYEQLQKENKELKEELKEEIKNNEGIKPFHDDILKQLNDYEKEIKQLKLKYEIDIKQKDIYIEKYQLEIEELKEELEDKDKQWASVVNTATRKLQDKIDELELENDDCEIEIDNEEIEKIKQMEEVEKQFEEDLKSGKIAPTLYDIRDGHKLCQSNMIGILGIEESDSEEEKEEEDPIEQMSEKGFADMCSEFPNGIPLNQMWKINTYDKKVVYVDTDCKLEESEISDKKLQEIVGNDIDLSKGPITLKYNEKTDSFEQIQIDEDSEESEEESDEETEYDWDCLYCGEKGNPDEGGWVSERCRKEEHLGTENMKDHPECDYKGYICNGCQWYGEQMCFKCQDFNGAFTGLLLEQQ